ncbi:DUF6804 family protein [Luteimicrobium subarcticum]|uniref:Uncharacterized protein n=1 Tax=Luteimicrobium subarcticum TaxID=620910 RepID=A0A2M8W3P9_9MICO|nr:DUF6804 family protein [Luteimicrobium subarcticum]PJI85545.1 hypothetical protein CLV34_2727 [Luteimicrobium subarcticum]
MSTRNPAPRGGRPNDRYGDDGTARLALVPGVLAAVAAVIGIAFEPDSGGMTVVRYVVAILALIMIVFAVQAKAFVWVAPLVAIAVLWNPVAPFHFGDAWWVAAELAAAALLVTVGVLVKVPDQQR